MKIGVKIFLIFLISSQSVFSQIWLTEKVEANLSNKFKFRFENEDRFKKFESNYEHVNFGVAYSLNKNISLNFNNRISHIIISDETIGDLIPNFGIDYKFRCLLVSPKLEYWVGRDYPIIFRNRVSLSYKMTDKIKLYISDEIFLKNTLVENRFWVGPLFCLPFGSAHVCYLLRGIDENNWENTHALACTLTFIFE